MSRYYRMSLKVRGLRSETEALGIEEAIDEEWTWEEDPHAYLNGSYYVSGESNLCGGESEEQFARRVQDAVLKAVGRPVEIEVVATFLENLPYETHELSLEEAAERLKELK